LDFATIVLFVLLGVIEIASVLLVNRRLSYEHDFMVERGTAGDQLGKWLTSKENEDVEDSPMMIDVLAARVGKMVFQSQRFSNMQEGSVEARHFNNVDEKVFEALKTNNPEVNFIARILEELGLGDLVNEKDLPYIMQKYGRTLGLGQTQNPSNTGVCR